MVTRVASRYLGDSVDHVHAFAYFAKHRVTPAASVFAAVVEKIVIHQVDEELRGRRVRVGSARHRQGAAVVLEAVVGFILDGGIIGLLAHLRIHAAALDHKAGDDAVENQAVKKTAVDVFEEVGSAQGRLLGEELDLDRTHGSIHLQHSVVVIGLRGDG